MQNGTATATKPAQFTGAASTVSAAGGALAAVFGVVAYFL